ncbi:MAG: outer membrane beta-barrel protein [Agitococcus sp.]|nr:outer membrane beta-barrel protein [Agitococcus sp.]MDO9179866.1 outer membrane beta-barrel protein [Agitococcus sp.]
MKRLTVALIAALSSPLVLAVEKPYIGIDYQLGTYTESKFEVKPEALRLRAGTELTPYFAIEAHAGIGTKSDVAILDAKGTKSDINVESYYGLFVRPQISLNDMASVYALLGSTYLDVSSSATAVQAEQKTFGKSFSYGVGADVKVYKKIRLSADYIKYMDSYKAISFGVRIPIE